MTSIQLRLEPQPTFPSVVAIPVAGHAEPATLTVTFKHRTKDALVKWLADSKSNTASTEALVLSCATGWSLPDEFSAASIAALEQNYIGACAIIGQAYVNELSKARLGN